MPTLPAGTVTFLFTDIEGSTSLWERYPQAMRTSLDRHHTLIHAAVQKHGGFVFQIIGDAFCAAFANASQAVQAAVTAQRLLAEEEWGETGPIRVRMGIHTGPAEIEAGDYRSNSTLNRVARVLNAGHGGQVLLSGAAAGLAREQLPPEMKFRDMGLHSLRGFANPEQLFQLVIPELPSNFPPLKTKEAARHNLPEAREPFFGRQRELAELRAKLGGSEARLVTIFGPGGMGKTRLAIETASRLAEVFPQGAWFVPLAPLTAPHFLAPVVLEALRLPAGGHFDPNERLFEYLYDKELLLVLDNIEHLLPAAGRWAMDLLQAAPGVKLLVTSRARLNVGAEWVYLLTGLDFPEDETAPGEVAPESLEAFAAPALFLQQAQRTSGYRISETELPCVLHVCRLVLGMPLALVLAASWVRLLSCEEIAEQVESGLDFLAADQPDLPERQRSIQAVFDYSWQTLSAEQQGALRRLSVFRGGFDRQAAAGVAQASLPILAALLDRSLIQRQETGRYSIHELLRQFAAARLNEVGETESLRTQHLNYFTQLAEQIEPELAQTEQKRWLDRLEAEMDNLRAALEWSLLSTGTGASEMGLRLATALSRFWWIRGDWREARRWLKDLLERAGETQNPRLTLRARIVDASVAIKLGDINAAKEIVDACLKASEELAEPKLKASVLYYAGSVAAVQSDEEKVKLWGEECLRLAKESSDLFHEGLANHLLGRRAVRLRDFPAAHRFYQASLEAYRQYGDRFGTGNTFWALGDLLEAEGNLDGAKAAYQESGEIFQELNDRRGLVWSEIQMATLSMLEGQWEAAAVRLKSALVMARETGEINGEIDALNELAFIALQQGQLDRTRDLIRQSLARNQVFKEKYWASDSLITLAGAAQLGGQNSLAARLLGMAATLDEFPLTILKPVVIQASSAAQAALGEEDYHRQYTAGQASAEELNLEALIQWVLDQII